MTTTGRFVWYELLTTDPAAAIAFYTDVIGWRTEPYPGSDYQMWASSQGTLGGVMKLGDDAKKMGAPPHWTAHISVADVEATVAAVQRLGGRVHLPPTDIPNVGRYSVIADPQGASISVFKPNATASMPPHDVSKPGEISWNELLTTDQQAAFRFYSELFGWDRIDEHDMGPMGKYLIYGKDGKRFGGIFNLAKDSPTPPAWLYYVSVNGLDAAVARAKAKGGRLINGPMEVPGGDRIAQLIDPQGVAFALHELAAARR